MERFARTLNRQEGNGMNFLKFHVFEHIPRDILDIGSLKNADGETGEKSHINFKHNAQRTQRRINVLDEQGGRRTYEHTVVERAGFDQGFYPRKTGNKDAREQRLEGQKYVVNAEGKVRLNPSTRKKHIPEEWYDTDLQKSIQDFLDTELIPKIDIEPQETLQLYTSYLSEEVRYRADPTYHYQQNGRKEGWHDFAMAYVPDVDCEVPIHIMIYVEIKGFSNPFMVHGLPVGKNGPYAICHIFTEPNKEESVHPESVLISRAVKRTYRERRSQKPKLYLLPVKNIKKPCTAVPDMEVVQTKRGKGDRTRYHIRRCPDFGHLFIEPRTEWTKICKDWIRSSLDEQCFTKEDKLNHRTFYQETDDDEGEAYSDREPSEHSSHNSYQNEDDVSVPSSAQNQGDDTDHSIDEEEIASTPGEDEETTADDEDTVSSNRKRKRLQFT